MKTILVTILTMEGMPTVPSMMVGVIIFFVILGIVSLISRYQHRRYAVSVGDLEAVNYSVYEVVLVSFLVFLFFFAIVGIVIVGWYGLYDALIMTFSGGFAMGILILMARIFLDALELIKQKRSESKS